jgi:hypothetical protein
MISVSPVALKTIFKRNIYHNQRNQKAPSIVSSGDSQGRYGQMNSVKMSSSKLRCTVDK